MNESPYKTPESQLDEKPQVFIDRVVPLGKRVGRFRYFALNLLLFAAFMSLYPLARTLGLDSILVGIGVVIAGVVLVVWPSILVFQRTMDIGGRAYWGLLAFVPVVNLFYGIGLIFWKGTPGKNMHGVEPIEKTSINLLLLVAALLMFFYSVSSMEVRA